MFADTGPHVPNDVRLNSILDQLGIEEISILSEFGPDELVALLDSYEISPTDRDYVLALVPQSNAASDNTGDADTANRPSDSTGSPASARSIILGIREEHNTIGTKYTTPAELPFNEDGLRRHLQIVGSSGSGKTVAARFIVEQAALNGVPSIVIDCQGDLSSLVLLPRTTDQDTVFSFIGQIHDIGSPERERDVRSAISAHLGVLLKQDFDEGVLRTIAAAILPRIFTPKRSELGLPISLPPFSAASLSARASLETGSEAQQLADHYSEEIQSIVSLLFSRLTAEKRRDFEELLRRLVDHARAANIDLAGKEGVDNLLSIAERAFDLAPDLFSYNLTEKDHKNMMAAIRRLKFADERPWLDGPPLDLPRLISQAGQKTPINIFNLHGLKSSDQHRVIRAIIGAVYRYAIRNPKLSEKPSLILFIDEVGTGFGDQSIAKSSASDHFRVYRALLRLVLQARKYGVCVVLSSQNLTHFDPQIRTNLNTKIVGRITDAAEQSRVVIALHDDARIAGLNAEGFVRNQLPGLSPPRLIMQTTKGRTFTYHQYKCCSLDLTLRHRDLANWRRWYEESLRQNFAQLAAQRAQDGSTDTIIADLRVLLDEFFFLNSTPPALYTALVAAYLDRNCWVNAAETLDRIESGTMPESLLELIVHQFRTTIGSAIDSKQAGVIASALNKWSGEPSESPYAEGLRVVLLEYHLAKADVDHDAVKETVDSLTRSRSWVVSSFATLWGNFIRSFSGWSAAWRFATKGDDAETHFHRNANGKAESARLSTDHVTPTDFEQLTSYIERSPESFSLTERIHRARDSHRAHAITHDEFKQRHELVSTALRRASQKFASGDISGTMDAIDSVDDDTLGIVLDTSEEIQQLLRIDSAPALRLYRVREWLYNLSWQDFEAETARLFIAMGYDACVTKKSGDDGVDVYAKRGDECAVIQCKHWLKQDVGKTVVQAIRAKATEVGATSAVLVTCGKVEPGALSWAKANSVLIIDGDRFIELMLEHYLSEKAAPPSEAVEAPKSAPPGPPIPVGKPISPAPPTTLFPEEDESRWEKLSQLARKKGSIANADVRTLLGIDARAATVLLRALCDAKRLVQVGAGRGSKYFPVETTTARPNPNESPDIPSPPPPPSVHGPAPGLVRGTVHYYNKQRRFGKIAAGAGSPTLYFFHANYLSMALDELFVQPGISVAFRTLDTPRGPQAREVSLNLDARARETQTRGRRGRVNFVDTGHAFVTDVDTDISLFLPFTAATSGQWGQLRVGCELRYDVAPSDSPEHADKWQITRFDIS